MNSQIRYTLLLSVCCTFLASCNLAKKPVNSKSTATTAVDDTTRNQDDDYNSGYDDNSSGSQNSAPTLSNPETIADPSNYESTGTTGSATPSASNSSKTNDSSQYESSKDLSKAVSSLANSTSSKNLTNAQTNVAKEAHKESIVQCEIGNDHIISSYTTSSGVRSFNCFINGAREVECSGDNRYAQLGNGSTNEYSEIYRYVLKSDYSRLRDVISLSNGRNHVCALTCSGEVYCWGANGYPQAVSPIVSETKVYTARRIEIDKKDTVLKNIKALVSGNYFNCALSTSGEISCWGDNRFEQLGHHNFLNDGGLYIHKFQENPLQRLGSPLQGVIEMEVVDSGSGICLTLNTGDQICKQTP